ncbi:MAG: AAA family ATPase [Actinobacteria bacterium]|nr:AAA family ATPase [Actinomycetota bacterium]
MVLLTDLVEGARGGTGQLCVIQGPMGIGKTRLLGAVRSAAEGRDLRVLSARAGTLERDFPYNVVLQLFEPELRRIGPRARESLFKGAAGQAAPILSPDGRAIRAESAPADLPFSIIHGLYWLTSNLAERTPLLIAVDDAHWTDEPSLRFLEYLAHRVGDLSVLLVLAFRTDEPNTDSELAMTLTSDPRAARLHPAPLSEAATTALVRELLASDAAAEFCRACHAATGGNPFFLHELIRTLRSERVPATASTASRVAHVAPEGIAQSMRLRLEQLGVAALRLARAVAVLGIDAELRHAAALAGLDNASASEGADALFSAEIFRTARPLEFVHPVVEEAVYQGISPSQRADAHARAAALLHEASADPDRIAVQLLSTDPAGVSWRVATLVEAAEDALAGGASSAAVKYLRRALAEPPDPDVRTIVLRHLGRAEIRVGDPTGIEHLREAHEDAPEIARELGHALLIFASTPVEALDCYDGALADLPEEEQELRLQLEADAISAARLSPATFAQATERLERVDQGIAGATPGERLILANLAIHEVLQGGSPKKAASLAERAVVGGLLTDQGVGAPTFYDALYATIIAEEFELAERFCQAALAEARAQGSLIGLAGASAFRSDLLYRQGMVVEAETDARTAVEVTWATGFGIFMPLPLAHLIDALIERGESAAARDVLREKGGEEIPDGLTGNYLLFSRGQLHLALGEAEQAARDLLEVYRREVAIGRRNLRLPYRSAAAVALARIGDLNQARKLADEELRLARSWGTPRAIGVALRARGLAAPGSEGIPYLRESVATLAQSRSFLEHARASTDLGAALRGAGLRSDAREPLRHGLDLAHRCGATALVDRAYQELLASGARPRRPGATGLDSLTSSERRIAAMAAQGLSNREIAQSLFLGIKTVEMHLSNAYRKLEIHSRSELPKNLLAHP